MRIPDLPLWLRRCVALPLIALETLLCLAMALTKLLSIFLADGPDGIKNVFGPKSASHIEQREQYAERETKHIRNLWG